MRILSFDIGICNLAYCVLDIDLDQNDKTEIIQWGIIDVTRYTNDSKAIDDLSLGLIQALDEHFPDAEFHTVILENQPVQKNPTMKSVQMVVYTYFQILKSHHGSVSVVKLSSAINKSKWLPQSIFKDVIKIEDFKGSSYQINKKLSIAMVQHLIRDNHIVIDTLHEELLNTSKKKDDLCDALLQGYKYLIDYKANAFATSNRKSRVKIT